MCEFHVLDFASNLMIWRENQDWQIKSWKEIDMSEPLNLICGRALLPNHLVKSLNLKTDSHISISDKNIF